MIILNQKQQTILNSPRVDGFFVMHIVNGSSYVTFSSSNIDITLSNGITYEGNSKLVSVSPPAIESTVDRELYTVILGDPDFELGYLLDTNFIGKLVEVRMVFVNQETDSIETNIADTLLMYKGVVDTVAYKTDLSSIGSNMMSISCASPLTNLMQVKAWYTSPNFQKTKINRDDECFKDVFISSNRQSIKWGKA